MCEGSNVGSVGSYERLPERVVAPGEIVDAGGELALHVEEANANRGRIHRTHAAANRNWITRSVSWLNQTGTPVTYFHSEWDVPDPPSINVQQLIYLFNGMETPVGSQRPTILQPVLEWGKLPNSWSITSRLQPGLVGQPNISKRVPVKPGDTLVGVMRVCDQKSGLFTYSCEFEGIPDTRLHVCNVPELVRCVEALEAYEWTSVPPHDLNCAAEYPNADRTVFRRIKIQTETKIECLDWQIFVTNVAKFGENTVWW